MRYRRTWIHLNSWGINLKFLESSQSRRMKKINQVRFELTVINVHDECLSRSLSRRKSSGVSTWKKGSDQSRQNITIRQSMMELQSRWKLLQLSSLHYTKHSQINSYQWCKGDDLKSKELTRTYGFGPARRRMSEKTRKLLNLAHADGNG